MLGLLTEIREDIQAALQRDPAARNALEVLLCYPGLHAVLAHRVNHWLWKHRLKLVARAGSQVVRLLTGVEIHPGAQIGRRFFIDHGMGVVIGETAVIGDDVTIYHGVTLGGTSLSRTKRHPTLGDRVVVGAGAKILGPCTVGHDSRVGSGSVLVRDVPPRSTVVGVPARVTAKEPVQAPYDLEHTKLPDIEGDAIEALRAEVGRLHARLTALEDRAVVEAESPPASARRA